MPVDPHAAASAHDPRRSPRGGIGPRSPSIPTRRHRSTIPVGFGSGLSIHRPTTRRSPRGGIGLRPVDPHAAASAHDPRRSPRGGIGLRPVDPHAAASAHDPRRSPRGGIGLRPVDPHAAASAYDPSIPTRRLWLWPVDPHAAASAHDPRRSPRGGIGPRSPSIPTRRHRSTIPVGFGSGLSIHRPGPSIPTRRHRPTTRRSPRGGIGPRSPSIPTRRHRPTTRRSPRGGIGLRPVDPHAAALALACRFIGPARRPWPVDPSAYDPSIPTRRHRPTTRRSPRGGSGSGLSIHRPGPSALACRFIGPRQHRLTIPTGQRPARSLTYSAAASPPIPTTSVHKPPPPTGTRQP